MGSGFSRICGDSATAPIPPCGGAGWSLWAGVLVTQIYLLARLFVKRLFYASQTALFQGTLADAERVAAREPVRPDSSRADVTGDSSQAWRPHPTPARRPAAMPLAVVAPQALAGDGGLAAADWPRQVTCGLP